MKISSVLLSCAIFGAIGFGVANAEEKEWSLVWSEEFEIDGAPDSTVWSAENGFTRNHELQWYQGENAYCKNGLLVIEALPTNYPNPMYEEGSRDWRKSREKVECTSASITTKGTKEFLYGRFEVKARIPVGGGAWPAIWLLGSGLPWPSCGEIDIMEYYRINGVPHILANAAWGKDRPFDSVWDSAKVPFSHFLEKDSMWASQFHIWRMDWDEEAIRIYLDDELINEILLSETNNGKIGNYGNPFKKPMYLLLNLAIGGDNGGTGDWDCYPMKYEIDYVRVYQQK